MGGGGGGMDSLIHVLSELQTIRYVFCGTSMRPVGNKCDCFSNRGLISLKLLIKAAV